MSSEPWKFSDIPIDDGGGGEIRKKKKEKKKKIDWQRQWHHKLYTEKKSDNLLSVNIQAPCYLKKVTSVCVVFTIK